MIASAPNLKVISNVGVGYNHIDAEAARAQGVAVGKHAPGVLSENHRGYDFRATPRGGTTSRSR